MRWAFASVLILVIGAGIFLFYGRSPNDDGLPNRPTESKPILISVISPEGINEAQRISSTGGVIRAPLDGRVLARINGDRAGMGPGTVVQVLEATESSARFDLKKGACAWSVAPRKESGEFLVQAGNHTVRVVGTRFLTALSDDDTLTVHVSQGVVKVEAAQGQSHTVQAGQSLTVNGRAAKTKPLGSSALGEIDYLLNEDPAATKEETPEPTGEGDSLDAVQRDEVLPDPVDGGRDAIGASKSVQKQVAKPSIEQLQKWIIKGELSRAATALETHLKSSPGDGEAWSLLADCRRKTGNWGGAVSALRNVIAHGRSGSANPARFKAGKILQDKLGRHSQAIELFNAYIEAKDAGRPLEVEAMMRIARSQKAIGRDQAARKTLETVIKKHDGTVSAVKARKLLEDLSVER
jgi:hypothetical protein